MPKSMSELREQLSAIEPNERTYEGIGPSEVDLLRQLLDDEEAWLAARAVHALSRIDAANARGAILLAAQSPRAELRVAAAASAGAMRPEISDEVLSTLLDDSELSVRKYAIKSASARNSDAVKRRVQEIATSATESRLQRIAQEKARAISPP